VCIKICTVLNSNVSLVVNVVFFLLDDSPTSEFYVPTWAHKIQTPENHPKEKIQVYNLLNNFIGFRFRVAFVELKFRGDQTPHH
jgi:hypothetical protein